MTQWIIIFPVITLTIAGLSIITVPVINYFLNVDHGLYRLPINTKIALKQYSKHYGYMPSTTDNATVYRALAGDNEEEIVFLELDSFQILNDGTVVDAWETPMKFSRQDDVIEIRSAGKDRIFNTKDDYVEQAHCSNGLHASRSSRDSCATFCIN